MVRSFWARRARQRRQLRRRQQAFTPQISCTCEHLEDRTLLSSATDADVHVHAIFAPDTPRDYVNSHTDTPTDGPAAFQLNPRWSATATNGSGLQQGDPTILTWSIVPDGTAVSGFNGEAAAPSNLVSYLGGIYGVTTADTNYTDEVWFSLFESIYDRWSELSGITFVYQPNDDGAALGSGAPGVLGLRGDMRLSGHLIDGNSGTLAYNFYPQTGDMVIDTGDNFFFDTSSNSIKLRNMLAHEVGHGIGIRHLESSNAAFLMEPFINTAFDGPQFDDVLGAHRWYGDYLEDTTGGNNSSGTAHHLGSLTTSGSLTIGSNGGTTSVAVADTDFVSIDGIADVDYYSFTLLSPMDVDVIVDPVGPTYNQGPQGGPQSPFDAEVLNNLVLEVIDDDGTSVLVTRNFTGAGGTEGVGFLSLVAGTYYVRVTGTLDQVQLYAVTVRDAIGYDDHGNDAGGATNISVPSVTPGDLEVAGDVDYFAFSAIAGADYTFETTLATLQDSTLTLYGTDGVTQLAFDDDGAGTLASLINWTATVSGTYYLKVQGYATTDIGTYTLSASVSGLPIGLVGIDFDNGGSSPNNWTQVTTTTDYTEFDLVDENGNVMSIDAVIDFPDTFFGYDTFAPPAGQLPAHSQPLAGLDGTFSGTSVPIVITFQDLVPGQEYEVYVFGGDTVSNTQRVTITGATTTQFNYSMAAQQLFVNSTLGSTAALDTFAQMMVADGSGRIQITMDTGDDGGYYGLAGLAIRPVEMIPSGPFVVDTTADTVDANPGDGVAEDASGNTSLRAAIMEANALAGANEIIVPAGTYSLSITGTLEDGSASGDLDITDDLTITGDGAELTIINGASIDRVLHVLGGTSGNPVDLTLQDVTITGGYAFGSSSALFQDRGAGMFVNFNTQVTIDHVVFRNNEAPRTGSGSVHGIGGAISNSGNLTVQDSRFEDNLATNSGGAIYMGASGASATILRTTFANNVSSGGGAILTHQDLLIEDSLFVGNSDGTIGGGNGGALNVQSGALVQITNSTLSGNSSVFGGAIYVVGTVRVNGSTITGNSASRGGGIDGQVSLSLENSIVAGNTASISGPDIDGGITSLGHNLIGNTTDAAGFVATDLLNVNPMLGPLADNGGPTLTHALLSGSPAIDAANTATAPATDQRGVTRPQGAAADIGAFEADAVSTGARLFGYDSDTDDIVEIDPVTGLEINRFNSPITGTFEADGLAFDGTSLFYLDGTFDTLYELDPDTGAVLDSDTMASMGASLNTDALAYYNGFLVAFEYSGSHRATFIDPASDTVIESIELGIFNIGGVAGAASRGSFFVSGGASGPVIFEIDAVTGAVLNSFASAVAAPHGIAFVDGALYIADISGTLREVNPDTGATVRTLAANSAWTGLGGDDLALIDQLLLTVDVSTIAENGGTATGTVLRTGDTSSELVVTLMSDDTSEAGVPMTVTILAGQATATIAITGIDDELEDGTQSVTITASASGYVAGIEEIQVEDDPNEAPQISPQTFSVNEHAANGFVIGPVAASDPNLVANLTFGFGSQNPAAAPVLQLTGWDDGVLDGQANQFYTPTSGDDNTIVVYDGGVPVATGLLTMVEIRSAMSFGEIVSLAQMQIQLTGAIGSDTTIFDAVMTATGGTGVFTATSTAPFSWEGAFTGFGDSQLFTSPAKADLADGMGGTSSFNFDFAVVASDLHPTFRIFGSTDPSDAPFTELNFGLGLVTAQTNLATVAPYIFVGEEPVNYAITGGTGAGVFAIDPLTGAISVADSSLLDFESTPSLTLEVTVTDRGVPERSASAIVTINLSDITESLYVSIEPSSISENGGAATGIVTRNSGTTGDLVVTLFSSDTGEATVPVTVTILDGDTSASFAVAAADDGIADGTQAVTISATAAGYSGGAGNLFVTDDEVPTLTVVVNADSISEGAGPAATTVTITRNTDPSAAMDVMLTSSDTGEATIVGMATIPAGQFSVTVDLNAVDDVLFDGTQTVTITATEIVSGMPVSDPTFGSSGVASTSLRNNIIYKDPEILVQPDGKVVVIGRHPTADDSWQVIRLGIDGTPDVGFAETGIATTQFAGLTSVRPTGMVLHPDGKLTVVGRGPTNPIVWLLARYNADGTPDLSFGDGGQAEYNLPPVMFSVVNDALLNDDGSMILVGNVSGNILLARILPNGDLDTSFGSGGTIVHPLGTDTTVGVDDVVRQPDGTFVVVGNQYISNNPSGDQERYYAARFNEDGSFDTTFDNDGWQAIDFDMNYQRAEAVALQPDGKLLIFGWVEAPSSANTNWGLTRLNPDGSLDTSFGADGVVIYDYAGLADYGHDFVVQPDGKILAVGGLFVSGNGRDRGMVRFNANGTLDTEFGNNGAFVQPPHAVTWEEIWDAKLTPDGKLVTYSGYTTTWWVERFDLSQAPLSGTDTVDVTDDEIAALTLTIDMTSISENAGVATGTVTRTGTSGDLVVTLGSNDPSEATVPASVTILAGQTSATFEITAVNDSLPDGTQTVTITASADGFTNGTDTIDVTDDDQPNIIVTAAYLTNGNNVSITNPVLGERVRVRVEYDTVNLPSDATYEIHFSVDGVVLSSGVTSNGAGFATGDWFWWRSGWFAEAGTHTVTVTLDATGTVAEGNESDNTASFTYTPASATDLPQKFLWPLSGSPFQDHYVTNYIDLDPRSGMIRDYQGGSATYDGHNAIDAGEVNFAGMDAVSPVFAAAGGTVVEVVNGGYDRNRGSLGGVVPGGPANYVIIDHGNGWQTRYWHLREDSLHVAVGDIVTAGQLIGYEGSSGNSTGSHLHFEVRHNGHEVETFLDPTTFWQSPIDYVGNEVYLIESGVTNYHPGGHLDEGPSEVTVFDQVAGIVNYAFGYFAGLRMGDNLQAVWRRPDNSVYGTNTLTVPQDYSSSLWWFSRSLPDVPNVGTWTVEFVVNGLTTFTGAMFEIVPGGGEAEIRVEDTTTEIVVDGRYTPFDFGDVAQGASAPVQTYTVFNHGYDDLEISGLVVPEGFVLLEGLSSTIAPNSSDTFTIALDTSTAGYFAGEVSIFSNDADEAETNFSVEGQVAGAGQELYFGISQRRLAEGDTMVANIRRTGSTAGPLTVTLVSADGSEVMLPTSVTIPAGQAEVLLTLVALDDAFVDGNQPVLMSATAAGFTAAYHTVIVEDDETGSPTLSVSIDMDSISEAGGTAMGTVTRNTGTSGALVVTLMSSDAGEASVPMTVTIHDGQTSATFTISGVDDALADGTQTVTITATAAGFVDGTDTIDITDNDVPTLTLAINMASISENGGTATGTVTRNTATMDALEVTLMSSDTTEASVPVTVMIPAGQASADFTITGVDDFIVDGTQTVTVTASATGFTSGMDNVDVTDGDTGPVTFVVDTLSDVVDGVYTAGQFSLREAVLLANASAGADTIQFHTSLAGGTITLGGTSLDLLDDVTITGLGMSVLTVDANDASSVVIVAIGVTAEITDLTLAKGNSLSAVGGGGIRSFGDLTLRRMTIRDSRTSLTSNGGGGGIYVQGGSLLVEDSHLHDNESNFGGGIAVGNGGSAEIVRTLLETNNATSGGGGGLRIITGAAATVTQSTFSGNTSSGGFGRGGAIHSFGSLVVSGTTFSANVGRIGGAVSLGFNELSTQATITNSTISGNQSLETGGGLHVSVGVDLELVNSTLVGNHSDFDGGGGGGGGIRIAGGTVAMHNTIVAGNLFGTTSSANDISSITGGFDASSSHNLIGNALSAGGLTNGVNGNIVGNASSGTIPLSLILDPTLADNGGPTLTHALVAGSLALDAGSNGAAVDHNGVALTSDQRQGAFARILDGDGDFTPTVDIGAFEAATLPALMVTIDMASISENGGTAMGTVTRNTGTSGALVVTLMSSDTGEASVPTMVTIPDGQASATFTITGVDDSLVDGTQPVTITASSSGFTDGTDTLDVTDNDVPTLTLSIDMASISENGGSATGTVTRNTPTGSDLVVMLMSSDTSEATVVASVTIPGGSASADFTISGIDDFIVDGTQTVTITATAGGFIDGTDTLDVTDNDVPTLTLSIDMASISENSGSATGTVTRNTSTSEALVVMLMSSDTGEASVPTMVTIPIGQASATFTITGVDDALVDGTQPVTITASSSGFADGTDTLDVTDNDVPALTLSIDLASIGENGGSATGTVTRNTSTSEALVVTLMSSDTGEASVPTMVTIPIGQASATFTITGVDDVVVDGTQPVTITASSSGFADGTDTLDVTDDDAAGGPVVVQVLVSSSSWSTAFKTDYLGATDGFYPLPTDGAQLRTLPWGIDQVRVIFDQDVMIDQGDLIITRSSLPGDPLDLVSFSHTGAVATWTLEPVAVDKLLLNLNDQSITNTTGVLLDGEFTTGSGAMQSGDGTPGGAFRFRVNVLAGDADASGQVDAGDVSPIVAALLTRPSDSNWDPFADMDASGQVDAGDITPLVAYLLSTLPEGNPPDASFPPEDGLLSPLRSGDGASGQPQQNGRAGHPSGTTTWWLTEADEEESLFRQRRAGIDRGA